MYVDFIREYQLIQRLIHQVPECEPTTTAVLCVSPDYSSNVAMQVCHHLSKRGIMPSFFWVDVPYPKEDVRPYVIQFSEFLEGLTPQYEKIYLVEAAVLSGNNYTWLVHMLMDHGFDRDDICTVALIQKADSIFDCDVVGDYVVDMPEFYFERYNIHWD